MKTLAVDQYVAYEASRDGPGIKDGLRQAIEFLRSIDPLASRSDLEREMLIMHVAFLVDPQNEFRNNTNIFGPRREVFSDHVSVIMDSDIATWCKKLHASAYWPAANRRIANLLYNWLRGTLDEPEALI